VVTLAVGDKITARVVHLGEKDGTIRLAPLARHHESDDQGEAVAERIGSHNTIMAGTRTKGKVTRVENYGAFIQLDGKEGRDGRGLLPLAETTLPRGADARKHFTVGQNLKSNVAVARMARFARKGARARRRTRCS
jgi:small subunit ribosomal protein S1